MVLFTVLGAVATGVLLWSEWRHSRLRLVAKPVASAAFVAVAAAAGGLDSAYGRWVLVALAFAAIGDVALLGRSTPRFVAGLAAFLTAHVAYVFGFGARGVDGVAVAIALGALAGPAAMVSRWLLPAVPRPLRAPVGAYVVVISVMVATAAGTVAADFEILIICAAIGFYLSDLAVARDRFVAPGVVNRLWGLPLYYAAQFAFAWSV